MDLQDESLAAANAVIDECHFANDPPSLDRLRLGLSIAWCEGRQAGLEVGQAITESAMAEVRAAL